MIILSASILPLPFEFTCLLFKLFPDPFHFKMPSLFCPLYWESHLLFTETIKSNCMRIPTRWTGLLLGDPSVLPSSQVDSAISDITELSTRPTMLWAHWPRARLWRARAFLPPGPHTCRFLIASALSPDLCMTLFNHTSQSKRVFPDISVWNSAPSHAITFYLLSLSQFLHSTNHYLKRTLYLFVYCLSSPGECGHHNNGATCLSCSLLCSSTWKSPWNIARTQLLSTE